MGKNGKLQVEQILRKRRGKYLVRWKGGNAKEKCETWEPVVTLTKYPNLLHNFETKETLNKKNTSRMCEHNRQRCFCKECGGSSMCEHGRQRYYCKDCGGAGICLHQRRRSTCKECGGSCICEHNRRRSLCKECGNCREFHCLGETGYRARLRLKGLEQVAAAAESSDDADSSASVESPASSPGEMSLDDWSQDLLRLAENCTTEASKLQFKDETTTTATVLKSAAAPRYPQATSDMSAWCGGLPWVYLNNSCAGGGWVMFDPSELLSLQMSMIGMHGANSAYINNYIYGVLPPGIPMSSLADPYDYNGNYWVGADPNTTPSTLNVSVSSVGISRSNKQSPDAPEVIEV